MRLFAKLMSGALVAGGLLASPALASSDSDTFTFRVEPASLTTLADARQAYQRLSAEAARYCRALGLADLDARTVCEDDVITHVVAAVDHDTLREVHAQHTQQRELASMN